MYVGPAFELGAHRTATSALCVALDGEIDLIELIEGGPVVLVRSVFVPAGVRHDLRFRCERIACLYADPLSGDDRRLQEGMDGIRGGMLVGHPREDELAELARSLVEGSIALPRAKREVEAMLDLPSRKPSDARVAAAIATIKRDPTGRHTLIELAASVGLSSSRLRHAFKEATGVPVKRYRIWLRIGFAMREVHRGATLTQAAYAAGFASSAHFSKAYRDMFGMAPSTFAAASWRSPIVKASELGAA